jgi:hypothetical protein
MICEAFHDVKLISCGNLYEDVKTILSAKHLVIGTGTFAYSLSLCSSQLKRLYCFEHHNVYYHGSHYEIIVLGVTNRPYPNQWEGDVQILLEKDYEIEPLDMSTYEEKPRAMWDSKIC